MRELVKVLAEMECAAGNLYADAAEYFRSGPELSAFLRDLEQDEILHYDLMNRIADIIRESPGEYHSSVAFDPMASGGLQKPLLVFREHISNGTLDEKRLLELLVDIEYSEWNDIFLYVIDTAKGYSPEFQHVAARLEEHKRRIARFLDGRHEFGYLLSRINDMKRVWDVRVLVVDDEPALVKLFKAFLGDRYEVDSAMDGEEALGKISSGYYDAIILDVSLPIMSGLEVCREVLGADPDAGKRILFLTGDMSEAPLAFFIKHDLQYLFKPVSLDVIGQRLKAILEGKRTEPVR